MPKLDSQEPSSEDMREQLETILPDIYAAVCKACGNLSRYFDEDDYNRYTQRIALAPHRGIGRPQGLGYSQQFSVWRQLLGKAWDKMASCPTNAGQNLAAPASITPN